MELLQTIWFVLIIVLLVGYAVLDGFDLGVGGLHLFARDEGQRRIYTAAIGPVWDGNEVWLLTGGGALFAAFPPVYATVFSAFYLPLMLVLLALIARAVALEFRTQVDSHRWRRFWDWAFGLGSLLAALLLGVGTGNLIGGLPLDAEGNFTGTFFSLLNPYALLMGLFAVVLFLMHGAVYLTLKTEDALQRRLRRWAQNLWLTFVGFFVVCTVATLWASDFIEQGLLGKPVFWAMALLTLAGVTLLPVALKAARFGWAFLASSAAVAGVVALTAVGLFPRWVPSLGNPNHSLTIADSSTELTLKVMLVVALVGMPLVLGYTIYVYRLFRGPARPSEEGY